MCSDFPLIYKPMAGLGGIEPPSIQGLEIFDLVQYYFESSFEEELKRYLPRVALSAELPGYWHPRKDLHLRLTLRR